MPSIRLPEPLREVSVLSIHSNRVVLEARSGESDEPLVVKCLTLPANEEEIADFKAEYLYLDALSHRSWAKPDVFGELPEGGYYFTLEKARGVTADRIGAMGWCPEAVEVARQILSALHVLHQSDIAQLDLKPEQILIDGWPAKPSQWDTERSEWSFPDLHVTLLDLGLARPFGTPTPTRGTVGYIAPELYHGRKDWGAATDLYSFGATMGELLGGRRLFAGANAGDIIDRQIEGRPDLMGMFKWGVPEAAVSWIARMLSPRAEMRHRDAYEAWSQMRELAPLVAVLELELEPSSHGTFVGRTEEIAAALRWMEEAGPGRDERQLTLVAPALAGTSRLLRRLRAHALVRGWLVTPTPTPASTERRRLTKEGKAIVVLDAQREWFDPTHGTAGRSEQLPLKFLRLRVGPMSDPDLVRFLSSLGVRSNGLQQEVIRRSVGIPGLARALGQALPSQWNTVVEFAAESRDWITIADPAPPKAWVHWVGWFNRSQDQVRGDALRLWGLTHDLPAVRSILAARQPTFIADNRPAFDFGDQPDAVERGRLWAAAVRAAIPEYSASWGFMDAKVEAEAAPAAAREWLEYGVRTRDPALIRRVLRRVIDAEFEAGGLEEALDYYTRAQIACEPEDALDLAGLERLVTAAALEFNSFPNRLPQRWSTPTQPDEPIVHSALRLWSAMHRRDTVAVASLVCDLDTVPHDLLGFSVAMLTLRSCESGVARGVQETIFEKLASWTPPVAWSSALLLVAEQRRRLLARDPMPYSDLFARFEELRGFCPSNLEVSIESTLGSTALLQQDHATAERHFHFVNRRMRDRVPGNASLVAMSNLASIATSQGRILEALRMRRLALALSAHGHDWRGVSIQLQGIAALAGLRAMFGTQLSALEAGLRVSTDTKQPSRTMLFRALKIQALAQLGAPLVEIAQLIGAVPSNFEPPAETADILKEALATAQWNAGKVADARATMRGVVDHLRRNSPQRAREVLAYWLSLESADPTDEFGSTLVSETQSLPAPNTPASRQLELAALGRAAERGWVPRADGLKLLLDALTLPEAFEVVSQRWELHWNIAAALYRRGDFGACKKHEAAARRHLAEALDSIPSESIRESMLGQRMVRRLLAPPPS